jgi:putative addiction module killer protein
MIEIKQTETFRRWRARLDRLAYGNPGDVRPVGQGISELRIDFGPGFRIYFTKRGSTIIILLCGGDKSTQANDIKAATRLAEEWSEQHAEKTDHL